MSRSGAGNTCFGGNGGAWSTAGWGAPCLGPQRMQELGNPMARSPPPVNVAPSDTVGPRSCLSPSTGILMGRTGWWDGGSAHPATD